MSKYEFHRLPKIEPDDRNPVVIMCRWLEDSEWT